MLLTMRTFNQKKKKRRRRQDDAITAIEQGITEINDNISDIMSLSANSRTPIALQRLARDTFRCKICHRIPMRPPVIVMKCCKSMLGCESFVNSWFHGDEALTKCCSCCRAARGYNETMLLRGLDDFLKEITKVIQPDGESDSNELAPLILN